MAELQEERSIFQENSGKMNKKQTLQIHSLQNTVEQLEALNKRLLAEKEALEGTLKRLNEKLDSLNSKYESMEREFFGQQVFHQQVMKFVDTITQGHNQEFYKKQIQQFLEDQSSRTQLLSLLKTILKEDLGEPREPEEQRQEQSEERSGRRERQRGEQLPKQEHKIQRFN